MGTFNRVAMALATLLVATWCGDSDAQVSRYEYIAFQSMTMTTTDFLLGTKHGETVTLAGLLRLPAATTGRVPAVIMMHGSGGPGGTGSPAEEWSKLFNSMGIATFAVDSFSGRGLVSTVTDQASFDRQNMIVDAYRALAVLGKHRLIDPARIAIMGSSLGAHAAIFSSLRRFQEMHGPGGGLEFAAYVGMYTPCNVTYRSIGDVSAKPIRLLHGTADVWVPVEPCRALVERLTKAGKDVRLTEYQGAQHSFDAPGIDPQVNKQPRVVANGQTMRRCAMVENEAGQIINADTNKVFAYTDACVELNPTAAYDEAATVAARAEIRAFLAGVFALKP